MKRVALILVLAFLVIVAMGLGSTAFAQVSAGIGCKGLDKAFAVQKSNPTEADRNSEEKNVAEEHRCV